MGRTLALVLPYAAWMVLMTVLPQTAWAYAVRGLVTAALLIPHCTAARLASGISRSKFVPQLLFGGGIGLLVFLVWIAPETWLWPDSVPRCVSPAESPNIASPYAPATCGWALTLAKLCASAFVISVAEELFFRKWLVEFAGFGWMLVLFGVEHMRWDLGPVRGCVFIAEGVFAGLCYGLLAKRFGILSAIIAHAITNLILGIYVITWDKWFYW